QLYPTATPDNDARLARSSVVRPTGSSRLPADRPFAQGPKPPLRSVHCFRSSTSDETAFWPEVSRVRRLRCDHLILAEQRRCDRPRIGGDGSQTKAKHNDRKADSGGS